MNPTENILKKDALFNDNYKVVLFINKGSNAETYRVKHLKENNLYFLKIFDIAKMRRTAFDDDKNLLEIELLKSFDSTNITTYKEDGEVLLNSRRFHFLITDYIPGETLFEKISRESFTSWFIIKNVIIDILNALKYLHSLPDPVIHNEIRPKNIMLNSAKANKAILIDFGYARKMSMPSKSYNSDGLNFNYVASECFNNSFSPQSDIFSVGAVMYHLLYGMPPWFKDISQFRKERTNVEEIIVNERQKTLKLSDLSEKFYDFEKSINIILAKALNEEPANRFQTADEFISALNGEIILEENEKKTVSSESGKVKKKIVKVAKGKGFSAIAGMSDLKEQLKLDVIDALHHPEEYLKYGVSLPNGMLLYGPPGCGKTFFAKHLAEEIGFNFMLITPSDLKSRYVNATQENIAKMFEDAEENAPTVIFIDEINELLPKRDSDAHEMSKSAVNEMLAQMDRTGEKGIFIIGATNYPQMIDPAILRAGRLEKKFFLPPPDIEAREEMFKMYLAPKPLDFGIDYRQLAERTKDYVSSDIEYIINEASRFALKSRSRITMEILIETIAKIKPSVSLEEINKYKNLDIEEKTHSNNRPIGFKR